MNKRWFAGLSLLAVLSLLVSGCQSRPTAEEIVAKMKEVEASIEDAHGVVEFSGQGQGIDMELAVEMWEKKPNKFRAEVLEASDADLVGAVSVTDGQQVWMYEPDKNKVAVGELGGMDEPPSPREMVQHMRGMIEQVMDASEVKLVGEEEVAGTATYKLEFTPKEDEKAVLPMGGKLTLWVGQEQWIPLQAHFIGDMVGEGWMQVRSYEFNTGLPDGQFQFEIPAGAEVVTIKDQEPELLTLDEAEAQAGFDLLVPAYVPQGATLIDVFAVDEAYVLHYDHAAVSFTVMQGQSPQMDIPFGETTGVVVRGQPGTLITDGLDNSFLSWTEDGVNVVIAGRISAEEVVKVAESLQ